MRVTAISGHGVKGPACFLVETAGRRLLLDLGEGPDAGRRPDLSGIGRVDAILVSHGHADHIGAMDLAPGLGRPSIHATPLVLEQARAERHGAAVPLPLGGETEILGIPVLTGRAGHAPGGVWIRLGGEAGLLYTGDFSHEGVLYAVDPFPRARLLVADCSYGDYDAPIDAGIADILALAAAGPVLLPAPAGGRGMEMAVVIHEAGLDLVLDPSYLALGRRLLDDATLLTDAARARLAPAVAAARPADPDAAPRGAVLAAAATAESGMAAPLAKAWAGRAAIVFTGHMAPGGAADTLVKSGRARFIRWNVHPRLSETLALVDAVQPQAMMPAFVAEPRLSGLLAKLPAGLAGGPLLEAPSIGRHATVTDGQ